MTKMSFSQSYIVRHGTWESWARSPPRWAALEMNTSATGVFGEKNSLSRQNRLQPNLKEQRGAMASVETFRATKTNKKEVKTVKSLKYFNHIQQKKNRKKTQTAVAVDVNSLICCR